MKYFFCYQPGQLGIDWQALNTSLQKPNLRRDLTSPPPAPFLCSLLHSITQQFHFCLQYSFLVFGPILLLLLLNYFQAFYQVLTVIFSHLTCTSIYTPSQASVLIPQSLVDARIPNASKRGRLLLIFAWFCDVGLFVGCELEHFLFSFSGQIDHHPFCRCFYKLLLLVFSCISLKLVLL